MSPLHPRAAAPPLHRALRRRCAAPRAAAQRDPSDCIRDARRAAAPAPPPRRAPVAARARRRRRRRARRWYRRRARRQRQGRPLVRAVADHEMVDSQHPAASDGAAASEDRRGAPLGLLYRSWAADRPLGAPSRRCRPRCARRRRACPPIRCAWRSRAPTGSVPASCCDRAPSRSGSTLSPTNSRSTWVPPTAAASTRSCSSAPSPSPSSPLASSTAAARRRSRRRLARRGGPRRPRRLAAAAPPVEVQRLWGVVASPPFSGSPSLWSG